ncbi:MAG: hypothetical protein Q7T25_08530, partial [Sideroxyarcus sp.]|nr:hypothetical protein [Sideroxyarcus sp.]
VIFLPQIRWEGDHSTFTDLNSCIHQVLLAEFLQQQYSRQLPPLQLVLQGGDCVYVQSEAGGVEEMIRGSSESKSMIF